MSERGFDASPDSAMTEQEAAQLIWNYYREHKDNLVDEVKSLRYEITQQLRSGVPIAKAFSKYKKPKSIRQKEASIGSEPRSIVGLHVGSFPMLSKHVVSSDLKVKPRK
jgi:hypothetical protein